MKQPVICKMQLLRATKNDESGRALLLQILNSPRRKTADWNNSKSSEFELPRVQLRTRAGRRPLTGSRQDIEAKSFVLETGGRAVLAFSARGMVQAKDLCSQHLFVEELASYRSCGRPIWDGIAELRMRCASAAEAAELQIATAAERARGEYEGFVFVFFVPVDADLQ